MKSVSGENCARIIMRMPHMHIPIIMLLRVLKRIVTRLLSYRMSAL
jgi:hypothetical protein